MADRGAYRAIKVVLLDGPDFQDMPAEARWLFVALKMTLGPSGIEVYYPDALLAEMAAKTGLPGAVVSSALDLLEERGWIARERNLVWITGQLEHDPHMNLADAKHRKAIWRHVSGLPRLSILGRFVAAYREWFEAGTATLRRRGGDVEIDLEPAPAELRALATASEGPTKALARPLEGPTKALRRGGSELKPPLRSTDNRRPKSEEGREQHTRDKSLGPVAHVENSENETEAEALKRLRSEAVDVIVGDWQGGEREDVALRTELSIWNQLVEHEPPELVNEAMRIFRPAAEAAEYHLEGPPSLKHWHSKKPACKGFYQQALTLARLRLPGRSGAAILQELGVSR